MALEQRKRLGRGLDALLSPYPPDDAAPQRAAGDKTRHVVPLASIEPNRRNPRRSFREGELEELATSIRQHGVIQPLLVRTVSGSNERFEIIAGERRWRAAQLANLHDVPIIVLEASDRQALELAIVENVQRADLNPLEEARGYQALIAEFGYSQGDLGAVVGKSRVHITNTLRLLKLPAAVLGMVEDGTLSGGHGRALLAAADPEKLARIVADRNLSVRETERLAQRPEASPQERPRRKPMRNADISALEKELSDLLGLKVELRHDESGRGELRVAYRSLEQLEAICGKLRV